MRVVFARLVTYLLVFSTASFLSAEIFEGPLIDPAGFAHDVSMRTTDGKFIMVCKPEGEYGYVYFSDPTTPGDWFYSEKLAEYNRMPRTGWFWVNEYNRESWEHSVKTYKRFHGKSIPPNQLREFEGHCENFLVRRHEGLLGFTALAASAGALYTYTDHFSHRTTCARRIRMIATIGAVGLDVAAVAVNLKYLYRVFKKTNSPVSLPPIVTPPVPPQHPPKVVPSELVHWQVEFSEWARKLGYGVTEGRVAEFIAWKISVYCEQIARTFGNSSEEKRKFIRLQNQATEAQLFCQRDKDFSISTVRRMELLLRELIANEDILEKAADISSSAEKAKELLLLIAVLKSRVTP